MIKEDENLTNKQFDEDRFWMSVRAVCCVILALVGGSILGATSVETWSLTIFLFATLYAIALPDIVPPVVRHQLQAKHGCVAFTLWITCMAVAVAFWGGAFVAATFKARLDGMLLVILLQTFLSAYVLRHLFVFDRPDE